MIKSKLLTSDLPLPNPTYPITTVIENWAGRTTALQLCLQPTHPTKTLPGGEEIS